MHKPLRCHTKNGFTLIELSIVLVIIGLIVGGVLVGRDLITASAVRAQVSQMERLNSAVNTFKGKYNNYLPGDIPDPDATQFGFVARGTSALAGQGNGDGNINGHCGGSAWGAYCQSAGEPLLLWSDLSQAKLLDGSFRNPVVDCCVVIAPATSRTINDVVPQGKIGNGNYITVWSWTGGINYFGLSKISQFGGGAGWAIHATSGLTVGQAKAIDSKMDDGFPQTGAVTAQYLNYDLSLYYPVWSAGGGVAGAADTSATASSSTTCFDNTNVGGAVQQYSMTQNNGAGVNCALSFKFQ